MTLKKRKLLTIRKNNHAYACNIYQILLILRSNTNILWFEYVLVSIVWNEHGIFVNYCFFVLARYKTSQLTSCINPLSKPRYVLRRETFYTIGYGYFLLVRNWVHHPGSTLGPKSPFLLNVQTRFPVLVTSTFSAPNLFSYWQPQFS